MTLLQRSSPSQLEQPPVLPWAVFAEQFVSTWAQGDHCFFDGPTKSGKTYLCRVLCRARPYVAVLGTKPRDPSLDAYVKEGYYRIDHWPPTRSDYRKSGWGATEARFIVWPKIVTRADLTRYGSKRRGGNEMFAHALDDMIVDGGWTVVADEGLWLSTKLDLATQLDGIAYSGRTSGITLMLLAQRPRGIPINVWTNALNVFLWRCGNTDDIRELSSLGTVTRRAVAAAIPTLRGHQFLYLPAHAQGDWAISEVTGE